MGRQKRMDNRRVGAWRAVLCLSTAIGLVLAPISYAGTISYTYDSLGRVRSVTYADGSTVNYTHDQAGNRVQVVRAALGPSAVNDAISTPYQTAKSFDPRTNDTDPNGFALSINGVGTPGHGTVSFTGTSITYTPAAGYFGADSFTYTIGNGHGGTATATVNVTVTATAPTANVDSYATNSNTAATVDPRTNDTDPQSSALTISAVGTTLHGTTTFTGNTITYTPASNYVGPDSFSYTIRDIPGLTATGTVNFTVNARAPIANADAVFGGSNSAITIDPRSNDTDPQAQPLTVTAVGTPGHGTVTFTGTSVTFTPAANYVGADSFTYTIRNTSNVSATGTVNVTINANAPTANADSATTPSNAGIGISPLANDLDPQGQALSIIAVGVPTHGTASFVGAIVTYTPTANYVGQDSFSYSIKNTANLTASNTISVNVMPRNPVANADSNSTLSNAAVSLDPRVNDIDPQAQALTVAGVGAAGHGTTSLVGNTVTYTPAANYVGADSFTYTIQNASGLQAASTVSVTVNARVPAANMDSASTGSNTAVGITPLSNDTDPQGQVLSVASVAAPTHGATSLVGNTVTYTPAANYVGADSFTYVARNTSGITATGTVNVTVSVRNPIANADSYATAYNTATTVDPRSNDSDPQGQGVSIVAVGAAGHGTVVNNGVSVTYTPTSGYFGADAFTYTIQNGSGLQASSTVNMTVNLPAAPTVGAVSLSVPFNTAGTVALSPSGVYSTLAVATAPAHGTASISGTTATYTPITGYSGADSFTYTAAGPGGTSAPATVSVTVQVQTLSASVSSIVFNWKKSNTGIITIAPTNVTASGIGGSGPYIYQWQYVSGDTNIVASTPNAATTTWTDPALLPGDVATATYRCKVTDSLGTVVFTQNVTVNFTNQSGV